MMHRITREKVTKFLVEQQSPCISLYLPTHRRHPENQQDPVRFRNLLQTLEKTLSQTFPKRTMEEVRTKLQTFAHDIQFWNHRTDGLAILCSSDEFQIFDLQRPVEELLVVANSFHLKPLMRDLQATDRYQLLALNRHEAKLYEGNRHALDEAELTNVASSPGLNLIYVHLNRIIKEHDLNVLFITGPGHGGPSLARLDVPDRLRTETAAESRSKGVGRIGNPLQLRSHLDEKTMEALIV